MCGIVAVLRRASARPAPPLESVLGPLCRVADLLEALARADHREPGAPGASAGPRDRGQEGTEPALGHGPERPEAPSVEAGRLAQSLSKAASQLEQADALLRGSPGLELLLADPPLAAVAALEPPLERVQSALARLEKSLDAGELVVGPDLQEEANAALVRLKDACWAIARDRLGAARSVADLAGLDATGAGTPGAVPRHRRARPEGALTRGELEAWWAVHVALASLDRLEVRGRDSAGIHVLVSGHSLDLDAPPIASQLGPRLADDLFTSLAVRTASGCLSFVYKAAAEVGELGDNVRALRAAIRKDPLLAAALASPGAKATVLAHTRWASVGAITEPNAHPLNSEELGRVGEPYVVAALNGDIDNHVELRVAEAIEVAPEVTTDAKLVPTLVARRAAEGRPLEEAFRESVSRFEGSAGIVASSACAPDELLLALRGSGQALYVGFAEDAFVVASEPYGLVEEAARYLRMDGEATRGQVVFLHREEAGTLGGVERRRYDGAPLALSEEEIEEVEITTRDVDRGGYPHFLLKEISEAPASFRKTLRGRLLPTEAGGPRVCLGEDALPPELVAAVRAGRVRRVVVVGQGTAAVAGQAVAAAVARLLPELQVSSMPATELSGFGLSDDMSDTLVVAVSQSGTTTDTNRTVDLVRGRGAYVVAIVNRRHSDLAAKAHGVLYTSDGRDVEMSVASTKAFYAQVAAGWLLAAALGSLVPRDDRDPLARTAGPRGSLTARPCAGATNARPTAPGRTGELIAALRELPGAMEQVLGCRQEVARIAALVAPPRRHWAVVGSGPDRVAAAELRIKLSELCYKSIACDATEDKKHIDLSSEPLVLVCAAGLRGPTADDVAKEVAIYCAHKALPVVVAAAGEAERFRQAGAEVIEVPRCEPELAFVLSAMVGHLFGYEAALAIDAQARPLREARALIETSVRGGEDDDGEALLARLGPELARVMAPFERGVRDGSYNGHLEAATAVRLVSLLRYATGVLPLYGYELETGKVGGPSALIADLYDALSAGISELTRPVDAIKHQAKTVTVGISRSEEALFSIPLVRETLAAGATADLLGYRALRALSALDEGVAEVLGYTRYRIDWRPAGPTIAVIDQGGLSRQLRSRTLDDPRLRGSKHRAAEEREVTVVKGASDGRTVVIVPEAKGAQVTGMTLLHVRFKHRLEPPAAKRVLSGYRGRYSALADSVTETEPSFDDSLLGQVPLVDLLTEPVHVLAQRWRQSGAGNER